MDKEINFYFEEPRLNFSVFSDFLFRFIASVSYIFLIGLCFTLLFSDIVNLKFLGILILFFLIDRLFHFNQAEKFLWEIDKTLKRKINLANFISKKAKNILIVSYHKAKILNTNFYLIFLKEAFKEKEIEDIFKRLEIKKDDFLKRIDLEMKNNIIEQQDLDVEINKLVLEGFKEALELKEKFIELRNLLIALLKIEDRAILNIFDFFNLKLDDLRELSVYSRFKKLMIFKRGSVFLGEFTKYFTLKKEKILMNLAWTARPTPILDSFSTDLTYLAKKEKIGFLIGHQKEFERLINIVSKETKPNALLIGEPSSGKTTIINHLAYILTHEKVPEKIFDKRLVKLDLALIMSNASLEVIIDRLKKIINEIVVAKNIILYLPDFDKFAKSTEKNTLTPLDILIPILKNDEIPTIAEANFKEYKQFLENKSEVLDLFEIIKVEEISENEALRFLVFSSLVLEKKLKIKITFSALKKAVELAKKYFRERLLPSSADELLKQALNYAKENKIKLVDEKIIFKIAQERTNIPLQTLGSEEKQILLNLEEIIHQDFIDQEIAVKAVANALKQYRAGLKRQEGPIASFLFVGPTGVGKTELAKILTKVQFGSENEMIRFDMSEFQEKNSIVRFLGGIEGDVNSLTNLVYDKPYSLILLDEFEKAHPDILNLFLQVFDDGRLTDILGRTVDFKNTIIIATSNAYSDFIKQSLEEGKLMEDISEEIKKKLTNIFRPELINRFSDIIVFRDLGFEEIILIAHLQLKKLAKNLKEVRNIEIKFNDLAVKKIAELGYDKIFGARPLRKVINDKIKSVLAEKILKDEIIKGDVIEVSFENNEFKFIKL